MGLMERRRAMMAKLITLTKLIATSTSGLVRFDTNVQMPVKVICEFSPIQEGTGDPSPDNVRPISGWTGCEISGAPKNILPKTLPSTAIAGTFGTGSTIISSATNGRVFSIYVGKNRTFNYRRNIAATLSFAFADEPLITKDGYTLYDAINCSNRNDETLYSGEHPYLVVFAATINTYETAITNNQARLVDVFDGQDYSYTDRADWSPIPITFTDPDSGDPLTVYGGTVTLNEDGSADLIVQHWILRDMSKFSSITAPSSSSGLYSHTFNLRNWTTTWDKAVGASNMICEVCVVGQTGSNYHIWGLASTSDMYFYDDTISTVAEFKTKYADCYILYRGKNSDQTYHFPNIAQLKSFLGTNNVWHDMNGSITAEYWNKQ